MKRKGRLIPMLRAAILKLLRKGDKDPTLPENCRPIYLLSVFYKVASCAISNRLRKCLPHIIGKQQKAYMPTDNIVSFLIYTNAIMNVINQKKLPALLLLIDSIDHEYIQSVLKCFNLGPQMC